MPPAASNPAAAMLEGYCLDCHDAGTKKGHLSL